jgi:hypothetical protein
MRAHRGARKTKPPGGGALARSDGGCLQTELEIFRGTSGMLIFPLPLRERVASAKREPGEGFQHQ